MSRALSSSYISLVLPLFYDIQDRDFTKNNSTKVFLVSGVLEVFRRRRNVVFREIKNFRVSTIFQ